MTLAQNRSRPAQAHAAPLGELNTTPLIDVLLVLLVMFIISIPIASHSLTLDLPGGEGATIHQTQNSIGLTQNGAILWNGDQVSETELASILAEVGKRSPEPATLFKPDANAQYLIAARLIRVVERSGISNFALAGHEQFASFAKAD